ncbi:hypothetical protein [Bacillus phage YungSlug]|nr:hypothetical protein [Bacillus phage YungSlug]
MARMKVFEVIIKTVNGTTVTYKNVKSKSSKNAIANVMANRYSIHKGDVESVTAKEVVDVKQDLADVSKDVWNAYTMLMNSYKKANSLYENLDEGTQATLANGWRIDMNTISDFAKAVDSVINQMNEGIVKK